MMENKIENEKSTLIASMVFFKHILLFREQFRWIWFVLWIVIKKKIVHETFVRRAKKKKKNNTKTEIEKDCHNAATATSSIFVFERSHCFNFTMIPIIITLYIHCAIAKSGVRLFCLLEIFFSWKMCVHCFEVRKTIYKQKQTQFQMITAIRSTQWIL